MFDVFRGIGVIFIIWVHSSFGSGMGQSTFMDLLKLGLMPAFFIASGYGFRPQSPQKAFKNMKGSILTPYFITAAVTAVLAPIMAILVTGHFRRALYDFIGVIGSFIFVPRDPVTMGSIYFPGVASCWYLIVLLASWCILCWLLQKFQLSIVAAILIVASVVGAYVSDIWNAPFCIMFILFHTLHLFIGYWLKKSKLLMKWTDWPILLYLLLPAASIVVTKFVYWDALDGTVWYVVTFGLYNVLVVFSGLAILLPCMALNRYDNKVTQAMSFIGRHSLLFICVHSVEMLVFPWAKITNPLPDIDLLRRGVWFGLRFILVLVICWVIVNRSVILEKLHIRSAKED